MKGCYSRALASTLYDLSDFISLYKFLTLVVLTALATVCSVCPSWISPFDCSDETVSFVTTRRFRSRIRPPLLEQIGVF